VVASIGSHGVCAESLSRGLDQRRLFWQARSPVAIIFFAFPGQGATCLKSDGQQLFALLGHRIQADIRQSKFYRMPRFGACDDMPVAKSRSNPNSFEGTPGSGGCFVVTSLTTSATISCSWFGLRTVEVVVHHRMEYKCLMQANSAAQFLNLAFDLSARTLASNSASRTCLSFSKRATLSSSSGTLAACASSSGTLAACASSS